MGPGFVLMQGRNFSPSNGASGPLSQGSDMCDSKQGSFATERNFPLVPPRKGKKGKMRAEHALGHPCVCDS